MEIRDMEFAIEGILFAAGEAVSLSQIARGLETDEKTMVLILERFMERFNEKESALMILRLGEDMYQMTTRPAVADTVRRALDSRRGPVLSPAAMEVLAIAAYNQPITKAYVEQIRGVDSSSTMNTLVERGLLEERGRLDVPGHPRLYGTTPDFLRCFGISSLEELPPLQAVEGEEDPLQLGVLGEAFIKMPGAEPSRAEHETSQIQTAEEE